MLDPHITKPDVHDRLQVTPDQRAEIHHAQIFHIDASQVAAGGKISGSDGKPGWSCYGTVEPARRPSAHRSGRAARRRRGFTGQPGLVAGWVPGQDPVIYPEHSGILLQPGDALVLQIHYHYDTTPVPDRSTVALQTRPRHRQLQADRHHQPDRAGRDPVHARRRRAAVRPQRRAGRRRAPLRPARLVHRARAARACAARPPSELAANVPRTASRRPTLRLQGAGVGHDRAVFGHVHTLGKIVPADARSGHAEPDGPARHPDVELRLADELRARQADPRQRRPDHSRCHCSWDRSLDPNRPPKYIVFAEGTEDEMCFSTYAIIPDNQS